MPENNEKANEKRGNAFGKKARGTIAKAEDKEWLTLPLFLN
jgi:hypothetical protein